MEYMSLNHHKICLLGNKIAVCTLEAMSEDEDLKYEEILSEIRVLNLIYWYLGDEITTQCRDSDSGRMSHSTNKKS